MAKTKTVEVIDCKINPNLNGLIIDSVKITSNKKSIRTGGKGGTGRKPKKTKKSKMTIDELAKIVANGFNEIRTDIKEVRTDINDLKNRVTVLESIVIQHQNH